MKQAVLAPTRKIHAPSEQTENVFLMFNMLKESERKLIKQRRDLEAMAIKVRKNIKVLKLFETYRIRWPIIR
jgi:hypothetical protein